jgi:hypothetical protein
LEDGILSAFLAGEAGVEEVVDWLVENGYGAVPREALTACLLARRRRIPAEAAAALAGDRLSPH